MYKIYFKPKLQNLIISLLLIGNVVCEFPDGKMMQSEDCGYIDEISGDLRTKIPWTAAIFLIVNSNPLYLVTGAVISPTTILTLFRKGNYTISHPSSMLVGVGMNSTNLELARSDKNAQIAEVSYIQPYIEVAEETTKLFYIFLVHLKTELNLKTPYVRSVCLPYYHLDTALGIKNYSYAENFDTLEGGFGSIKNTDGSHPLQTQMGNTGTRLLCELEYYERFQLPIGKEMACYRLKQKDIDAANGSCLLHGALMVIRQIHSVNRYVVLGMMALQKGRKKNGICTAKMTIFNGRIVSAFEWIDKSLQCGPFRFPCLESGRCLPLEKVCDSRYDCGSKDGSDEEPKFCGITNICKSNQINSFRCNLYGSCVETNQQCYRN